MFKSKRRALSVATFILFIAPGVLAQRVPTITSINPSSVTAGTPGFTLTVSGSLLQINSVVRVNGSNRPTVFISSLQLSATIFPTDVVNPGILQITVFTPFVGAAPGGFTSNALPLAVVAKRPAIPPPTLSQVAPGIVTQGATQMTIKLFGTNFRPGARVIISPPLPNLASSTGRTSAADIAVLNVTRFNSTLMTAVVSLSPRATLGVRGVDVLNLDGTTTAGVPAGPPGTTQPLRIESANSLAAPLSVLNLALTHPRDGTVVAQGDELNAEAIVAGAGTGTVIGQWIWDGAAVEQFAVSIIGGQSAAVRTRQSLPTWYLGVHTLQLRMIQPNQVATRTILVAITPRGWQLQKVLYPDYGAMFPSDRPPALLWAPVPGAAKYQVGFSSRPYFSTVQDWHDVTDNRWNVPFEVWRSLPEGELFWTVRVVETSGATRKPLPMRSLVHLPEGVLASASAPSRSAGGHTELQWKPVPQRVLYFITISGDREAAHILRSYLTSDPRLDLGAVEDRLEPGKNYFWRVDAVSFGGKVVLSGPPQSFVAGPHATADRQRREGVEVASLGAPPPLPPASFDLNAELANRTPTPGSSVAASRPTISVELSSAVNPADITLMVDDVDITSLAQVSETKVSYTPPLDMPAGEHNVNLTVANEVTSWKFSIAGPANAPPPAPLTPPEPAIQPGTDAEAPPPLGSSVMPSPPQIAAVHAESAKKSLAEQGQPGLLPTMESQISSSTQWASGSNPPDSNTFSVAERVAYENGPWHTEVNGSGMVNSILNPEAQRSSLGHVNDYIFQLGYKGEHWGANLRFGIVAPVLYTNAQFVTAATPRQGAEVTLTTPAGVFGYYANTNDQALGGGSGISFHQQLMGASWQAPLPKRLEFRLMWLSAQDIGAPTTTSFDALGRPIILPNAVASKSKGDVYGGLLAIHLTTRWMWSSEYAFSRDNPDTSLPGATRQFGRAWRTGVSGQAGNTVVNIAYRDVGLNFGNPANPSLTQASKPDLRGVDADVAQTTFAGTFDLGYSFLQNQVHAISSPELLLHSFTQSWTKSFGVKTNLMLGSRESLTQTGTIPSALLALPLDQQDRQDQRDLSSNITLSRQIGTVTMSISGIRDWSRNNLLAIANTITSSLSLGTNWVSRGFFQLNSQVNLNWVAADKFTAGETRNITAYLQPAFLWKGPGLQLSPLLSLTQGRTMLATGTLTNDSLTGQYGGRLSWIMPGALKFSTFAVQGSYNQDRNTVANLDQRGTQLLVLWTATWGHKQTF